MILDLHTHSIKSDDGRAKVQNYCQWIRTRSIPIDGFVLTEHRQFDFESDYGELARKHDLVILKGSEVETEYGHVLVFGVTEPLYDAFDFASIGLPLEEVIEHCNAHDAVAVPCHPGRPRVGMAAHLAGSRGDEDALATQMAEELGYLGIGGSDSHIVSHIGRCATEFSDPVTTEAELVRALKAERFQAIPRQQ